MIQNAAKIATPTAPKIDFMAQLSQCRKDLTEFVRDAKSGMGDRGNLVGLKTRALAAAAVANDALTPEGAAASEELIGLADSAEGWARAMPATQPRRGGRGDPNEGTFGPHSTTGRANPAAGWQEHRTLAASEIQQLPDGDFASLKDFLCAVRSAKVGEAYDSRLNTFAGQIGSNDSLGGFLIPERHAAELIQTADELAPWLTRRRSFDVTGPGDGWKIPALADRDRSSGDVAGLKLRRTAETSTIDDDAVVFESRSLHLTAAKGLVYASNELLADATIGLDSVLREVFGRAVMLLQTEDFVRGSGGGEPMGVLNSPALYTAAKEGSQVSDTITYQNVIAMRERCWDYPNAIWLYHPSALAELMSMVQPIGTSGALMWQPSAREDAPDVLVGRPAYATESCSLIGDVGDLLLVVPRAYGYASRPMRIDYSPHVKFASDEAAWRIVVRDDGFPLCRSTRTDARGFEQSEFITLEARA